MDMNRPSVQFEDFTRTFSADAKFFDALMSQPCGEAFAEMCVWYNWLRQYLNDIQESLADAGKAHGERYTNWVVLMLAGMAHAISMMMYLSLRGIIHEAGASGRRALEFLGIASHLTTDPSKAQYLFDGCESSPMFKKAFLSGPSSGTDELKRCGIKYRFASMDPKNAKVSSGQAETRGLRSGWLAPPHQSHSRASGAAALCLPVPDSRPSARPARRRANRVRLRRAPPERRTVDRLSASP
jgi:hypothetical protein